MTTRPVIFISAVSRELHSARDLVAKTLIALGFEPKWQDIAPSETGDLRGVLRKWVDDSAAVLQLVGHCYGFGPEEPDPDFGPCSYTQYEALYARQQGKKVWYLILGPDHEKDGCASEPATLHDLQDAYRQTVKSYGDLYHSSDSLLKTENVVLKLRDDLAKLREEGDKHRQLVESGIATIKDQNDLLLAALRDLPGTLGKQAQSQNPQDQASRLATAYAELEKQHHLPPGSLEKELPKFAEQLLLRTGTSALDRANALFATKKFAECEAAALQAKDQALAAARKHVLTPPQKVAGQFID